MIFSKTSVLLGSILSAALLSGCNRQGPATATSKVSADAPAPLPKVDPSDSRQTFTAAGNGGSPHFEKVIARLDVGGKMIQFQDHEGRRDFFIEVLNAVFTSIPEVQMKVKPDPAVLIDASGLAQGAASGRSLIKDGDAWLMRGYEYLPDGVQGLSRLLGKEPVAFKSPSLIPAATDLVLETRLDATFLPDFIRRICTAAGNTPAADELLNEKSPDGETIEGIMSKTDLHLILGVDVSSWAEKPVLPKPIDYFVRIEGGKQLIPLLLPGLEKNFGKPAAFGTRQGWEIPLPAIGMKTKGVLLFDEAGTFVLASRNDYLKFVDTAAMKLAGWKEYQAATDHFPQSGNFLLYASPQVPTVLGWAIRQVAKDSKEEGAELLIKATEYLQPRPCSVCIAHEADGISLTAELPFAAEMDVGATLPVLTATSTLFVGARAWKRGSDRAACIINTRNVQQAVRGYANMNDLKPGAPIPWDKIIGEGGMLAARPTCIPGATYTFAKTIPKTGQLACTCSDPEHAVNDHANW